MEQQFQKIIIFCISYMAGLTELTQNHMDHKAVQKWGFLIEFMYSVDHPWRLVDPYLFLFQLIHISVDREYLLTRVLPREYLFFYTWVYSSSIGL